MYAFFLDIDGTIYDGKQVSGAVVDTIVRARSAGHKVFINTARAYIGMPEQVYKLPVDGWVNAFGLEIFADGKFIHRKYLSRQQVLEAAKYAFDKGVKLYFEGEIRLDLNCQRQGSLNPKDMDEFTAMLGENRVCKFALTDGMTEADRRAFEADFDFYDIEVIAKGYSKTRGIQIVQEYYGIAQKNTVAIGDTDPDIDMVNYAGIGIAMGNGTPNLKAHAQYVTRTIEEHGVAYAIDCLLSGNLSGLEKE